MLAKESRPAASRDFLIERGRSVKMMVLVMMMMKLMMALIDNDDDDDDDDDDDATMTTTVIILAMITIMVEIVKVIIDHLSTEQWFRTQGWGESILPPRTPLRCPARFWHIHRQSRPLAPCQF
jgi:hypothetical protein